MKRDPKGRVAIVTGASSGVGWACAEKLADAGVKLCVTARRKDALEELSRRVHQKGGECIVVPADATHDAEVQAVVDECMRHYGRIDYLVAAHGVQSYALFENYRWEEITRILDINLFGYMRFARAVLPHLHERNDGHLIIIASMLSKGATPLLSAYVASKHAIFGWAETLRLELYQTGIDVSSVLVPSVATPMFDHAATHVGYQPRPVPPTYKPELVAKAVLKLAKKPKPKVMPAFIQGPLFTAAHAVAAPLTDFALGRFGVSVQEEKSKPIHRPDGNLFQPVEAGVGPRGSIPPTPAVTRAAGVAALFGLTGAALFGAGAGIWKAARSLI